MGKQCIFHYDHFNMPKLWQQLNAVWASYVQSEHIHQTLSCYNKQYVAGNSLHNNVQVQFVAWNSMNLKQSFVKWVLSGTFSGLNRNVWFYVHLLYSMPKLSRPKKSFFIYTYTCTCIWPICLWPCFFYFAHHPVPKIAGIRE